MMGPTGVRGGWPAVCILGMLGLARPAPPLFPGIDKVPQNEVYVGIRFLGHAGSPAYI